MANKDKQHWKDAVRWTGEYRLEIPKDFRDDMLVPGVIFTDRYGFEDLLSDEAPQQVINVATMPGIVNYSLAMPDIHYGYGFPIGGVAAFDTRRGVISPGGVGFDINCGVRLLTTNISELDIRKKADLLCAELFSSIPCGVGSSSDIRLNAKDMDGVLSKGAAWAVRQGYGWEEDLEFCEEGGALRIDNPEGVSRRARERGQDQLGTLGSGNHFIEVQVVQEVYDERAARVMGLEKGAATVMIHSGSRGLGHQVCTDAISLMREASRKYGMEPIDRQLSCAPVDSSEGREYYQAMAAAANFAWANRHCMAHTVRLVFERVFGSPASRLGMHLVYDVAHNIAKFEEHEVAGKKRTLCVHRKGATRALPAGHPDIPEHYSTVGQPVIVPGDMGRASFVLAGTEQVMTETWGSICHGAGRLKSRSQAKKTIKANQVLDELAAKGITIQAKSKKVIVEEASSAYKNINKVVETCVNAGIANRVVKLKPVAVIKG